MIDQNTPAPNIPGMHYSPFEGAAYRDGFTQGLKLLMLGESHYGGMWSETAPTEVVEGHVRSGAHPFFDELQFVVTGVTPAQAVDRQTFWSKVAFTNMVQEPLATADATPSRAHWAGAWAAFPEIIRRTMPDVIFVFSRRGWNIECHFDSPFTGSEVDELRPLIPKKGVAYLRDFSMLKPGYRALSGCFDHPSYIRRSGLWNEWHGWAASLLDAAPRILGRTRPSSGS